MSEYVNDAITHFTLGSSPLFILFPMIFLINRYRSFPIEYRPTLPIPFEALIFISAFMYGFLYAFMYYILTPIVPRKQFGPKTYLRFILSGTLAAFIQSYVLENVWGIYTKLWGEDDQYNYWHFHIGVSVFYLLYITTVGQWIRYKILYPPEIAVARSPPPRQTQNVGSSIEALKNQYASNKTT